MQAAEKRTISRKARAVGVYCAFFEVSLSRFSEKRGGFKRWTVYAVGESIFRVSTLSFDLAIVDTE